MSFLKIFSLFIVAVLLVVIFIVYQLFIPKSDFPTQKIFIINKNESGNEIFKRLETEGYIRNIFWIKVAAKIKKINKFYPGQYNFEKTVSTFGVLKIITSRPVSLAVLIPEGFTKKQIADRLEKYIIQFDKQDFLKKANEGYLFPDTYYFYAFSTNDEILKEFSDKYNKTMLENFGRLPTKDEVIIASMLEREARVPEDMKMISGIIQNRLKINMALQIDATVLYGKGAWKERVLYSDLKHESDYNTYQNTGLPIGPISNPGLNALKAAIYPTKNKYLYYLTGKDGKMYYADNHDDHIGNKIKYLR